MASRAGMSLSSRAGRTAISLVVAIACLALAGCGASRGDDSNAHASDAMPSSAARSGTSGASGACAPTVLDTLERVAMRVYREGVASERTGSALHLAKTSIPLREAVERDDPAAAQAAARVLLATGHLTNLRVRRGSRTLADVGAPGALAPLHGTIADGHGVSIGSFVTSVWATSGFIAELDGVSEGTAVVRAGEAAVAGSPSLPEGQLPAGGVLTQRGIDYRYTSFPVTGYPDGQPLQVYLLRSLPSLAGLCAGAAAEIQVKVLTRIATLIYAGESGRRTLPQIRRVQRDAGLLRAVAGHDPAATRAAVERLLHQHIVRLRVSDDSGRLLADVGGPYVLAPVRAPLRLGGRTIGSIVLSIQDDEGYKRLAQRLAGLDVAMRMGRRVVKSSLGPKAPPAPDQGLYRYRGRLFSVFTIDATAFPSGPLKISVLIPIPYV